MTEELCLLPGFLFGYFCGIPTASVPTSLTLRMLSHGLVKIYFQAMKAGSYLCRHHGI